MERLNERLFRWLCQNNASSALVGPPGCSSHVPSGAEVSETVAGPVAMTLVSGMALSVAMAYRLRPAVVLAGSGLTAPAAVASAKLSGATAAVYLHGLDVIAPSRIYRAAWLPCIRRCDRVLVNSRNTRRLAIEAGVVPDRITIVHPGTDLPQLDREARARFRRRHGIDVSAPVLLSVGRMTARKGLAEFVDRSLPSILAVHPTARLVIVGDQAEDALHRGIGSGMEPIQAAARAHGIGDAVLWLGPCSDAELADAFQGADLHVFPVRDIPGDVEGFGMVAIEAAAYGLQTVAFDVGGVADAVSDGNNGCLVQAGGYDAFARAVCGSLAADAASASAKAIEFAQNFGWDRFGREVFAALKVHQ